MRLKERNVTITNHKTLYCKRPQHTMGATIQKQQQK